jgi:hypothetical protein
VSDLIKEEEESGTKHFVFLGNATHVFTYDPVINSTLQTLVSVNTSINAMAVDYSRLYLFTAEYDGK